MPKAAVFGKTTKVDLPNELFDEPFHQSRPQRAGVLREVFAA